MDNPDVRTQQHPTPNAQLSEDDLWLLSYYHAAELDAALMCAKLARVTGDDDLRVYLTEQCAEEAKHAWLFSEAILKLGAKPIPIDETYQSLLGRRVGLPTSPLEFFALTKVVEVRAYEHYQWHLQQAGVDPIVADVLRRILDDEKDHVSGMNHYLKELEKSGRKLEIERVITRYEEEDRRLYSELVQSKQRLVGFSSGSEAPR